MTGTIAELIKVAKNEVGYHEGRTGMTWNNRQKYSEQVPGLSWSDGQPWCATFVSWCALKANLADYFPRTASTDTAATWWKSRKQWSEYPAIGAQVLYGDAGDMSHTGIVYGYDENYIYTIEGNTNTSGSREGDGVYLKKRARHDTWVQGYGYPKIPGAALKSADPNYRAPTPAKEEPVAAQNYFTLFRDRFNHDEVADLSMLDGIVDHSKNPALVAAAKECRYAIRQAVRTLIEEMG